MRPGEFKILFTLTNHLKGLTFKELKEKTQLSSPVLSDYLTTLSKQGILLRNPKTRQYHIAYTHLQKNQLTKKLHKDVSTLIKEIPWDGQAIAAIQDDELRKKVYSSFFSYHLDNLTVLIVMCMRNSILDIQNVINKYSIEPPKKQKAKILDKLAKKWISGAEKMMEAYSTTLNEKLGNIVTPYIHMLSLFYFSNLDFTLKGIDKELLQRFEATNIEKTFWFSALHERDQKLAKEDPEFARLLDEIEELSKETNK